jgi:hypothetical protein
MSEREFRSLCDRTRPPTEPMPAAKAERKATGR